jgi:hypothetical protein
LFTKNKLVDSTDNGAGLSEATLMEVRSQNSEEDSGSTANNKILTFKLLISGNKFGFACNIWAYFSANITIHYVVTGIISFKSLTFNTCKRPR